VTKIGANAKTSGGSDRAPIDLRQLSYALVVLAILCAICAPLYVNRLERDAPRPVRGVVSYVGWTTWRRPVTLEGQWRMVWRAPTSPGGPRAGDVAYPQVPGGWDTVASPSGRMFPISGLASYQLTIRGLRPGFYTLFVPTIFHANRVLVNGRVLSHAGEVGETRATTQYHWRAQTITIDANGGDISLEVDVAAFRHASSGFDNAPILGVPGAMDSWMAVQASQQLLFIVSLIMLFFYGAVVFAFRPRDYPSLYFALTCILLTPTAMVLGHDNLILLQYPDLSFPLHMGIEYITCLLTFMGLLAYTRALFPHEVSRWVYWPTQGLFIVSIAFIAVLLAGGDTFTASAFDRYPIFLAVFELLYVVAVVSFAAWRQRTGAVMFLIGMVVFVIATIEETLVQYHIFMEKQVFGYDFAAMGVVVFAFCHLIILAERWSNAMTSAENTASDLRSLMDISNAVTSELRLDKLLRMVIDATSRFLHADRATLFLHDPSTDELWSMVAQGVDETAIRLPAHSGIVGASFTSGDCEIVNDAYADPRFNRTVDQTTGYHTRSLLTLPIVARDGRRLGVMQALNRRDGKPFSADDAERIQAFAAHAAVAIDNANLFADVIAARNYSDSILASMAGGVMTLDAEGRLATINAAAQSILEVDGAELKGRRMADVLSAKDAWLLEELQSVRADNKARAMLDVEIHHHQGRSVSVNLSIVPLVNDQVSVGLLLLFEDISQQKRLMGAMRRFMTQRVVDRVLEQQDDLMFGSTCVASVLFADIRGFTSMAENLQARQTVDMLNEVFTELVEAVSANDGVVDKFIGDAVMAVFGAPISSGRDAANAVAAAETMMRMMASLNERRAERGEPPLRLGVGVATGELIAGTIGSPKRMDYTVIGDSVNLASRVQDLTKAYGVGVLICEATAKASGGEYELRHIDTVAVRGRQRPERLFELLSHHTAQSFPNMNDVVAAYDLGMARMATENWRAAAEAFGAALKLYPQDRPSALMLERALTNIESVSLGRDG